MIETPRAAQAWADYLALPERSLEKLLDRYQTAINPPSRRLKTLAEWSSAFGWQARLKAIADAEAKAAEERERAYRRSILEDGYGLSWERVKTLKELATALLYDLTTGGKRWVTEPKMLGSGPLAQVVDLERFNTAEVEQLRGLLDDIAKEKQERKESKVVAGDPSAPLRVIVEYVDADRSAAETA